MRQWLALLIVVAGAGCIAAAVSPARAPVFGTQDAYAKTCHVGYVHANFPWGERCIRAGQYCKKAHNLEYADHGFQCMNGKLRLGKPCPPSGKVNVHWHYSANRSAGGWSATRSTSCTNGSVSIGPQATEGDLKLDPGTPLKTGYSFSLPGDKLPFTGLVVKPAIVFQLRCVSGAAASPSTLAVAMVTQSYSVPGGGGWIPTGDVKSPLSFQGSATIPNACAGGKVRLDKGGTFSAVILLF